MEFEREAMGQRIAKRRKQLAIMQNVLAENIGISNNHLSSIECGKATPSLDLVVKICNALEVTPDYLLMGTMHSTNVPQNIYDGLRLCSQQDIDLISVIVQHMVSRRSQTWNENNFV